MNAMILPTYSDGRGNASRRSLVLAFLPSRLSTTVNMEIYLGMFLRIKEIAEMNDKCDLGNDKGKAAQYRIAVILAFQRQKSGYR